MKNLKKAKPFAFKLAEKQQVTTKEWKARENVATAGCSGPWARARRWSDPRNSDSGMFC